MKLIFAILLFVLWCSGFVDITDSSFLMPAFMRDGAQITCRSRMKEMMRQGVDFRGFPQAEWPNGTVVKDGVRTTVNGLVPFTYIHMPENTHSVIKKAIDEWNEQVGDCVYWRNIFGKCRSTQSCVEIRQVEGCSSHIGKLDPIPVRIGNTSKHKTVFRPQNMSLEDACVFTNDPEITILHEMEHNIGMDHEHVRSDRDEYIEIDKKATENVSSEFVIPPNGQRILLGPYDYYSIMHYNPNTHDPPYFRIKKKGINIKRVGRGRNDGTTFSELDLKKIRMLYKCGDKPK